MIEKVLEASKQKMLKPKIDELLSRMKKEKLLSIQDLRAKNNTLKTEVVN